MRKYMRPLCLASSLVGSALIIWLLSKNFYSNWLVVFWGVIQFIFILCLFGFEKMFIALKKTMNNLWRLKVLFILLVCLIPAIVRIFVTYYLHTNHLHRDEFIAGFISSQINFATSNFFNPQPQDIGLWVAQFPSLYFYLQGAFFKLFGLGFWQLKFSNVGYLLASGILTYQLAFRLFKNHLTAGMVTMIFGFLAPAMYFDTLNTHFVASTCVYLLFLNILESFLRKPSAAKSSILGLVTGYNYLFYISSYIALPLAMFGFLCMCFNTKLKNVLGYVGVFFISLAIVLSPFVVTMVKDNFYLGQRFRDLNLLTNKSEYNERPSLKTSTAISTLKKSFGQTFLALIKNDVGGAESYAFGKQKFLEPLTLGLVVLGFLSSIYLGFRKRQTFLLMLGVSLVMPLLSVAISTPPPGIHRLSLTFPIIAVLIGVILDIFVSGKRPWKILGFVLFLSIIFLNIWHFNRAVQAEILKPTLEQRDILVINKIQHLQTKKHLFNKVYVAAYPGFAIDKIYHFLDPDVEVITNYHKETALALDPQKPPYLYIVLWPQDYLKLFEESDPLGTSEVIIPNEYGLFYRYK